MPTVVTNTDDSEISLSLKLPRGFRAVRPQAATSANNNGANGMTINCTYYINVDLSGYTNQEDQNEQQLPLNQYDQAEYLPQGMDQDTYNHEGYDQVGPPGEALDTYFRTLGGSEAQNSFVDICDGIEQHHELNQETIQNQQADIEPFNVSPAPDLTEQPYWGSASPEVESTNDFSINSSSLIPGIDPQVQSDNIPHIEPPAEVLTKKQLKKKQKAKKKKQLQQLEQQEFEQQQQQERQQQLLAELPPQEAEQNANDQSRKRRASNHSEDEERRVRQELVGSGSCALEEEEVKPGKEELQQQAEQIAVQSRAIDAQSSHPASRPGAANLPVESAVHVAPTPPPLSLSENTKSPLTNLYSKSAFAPYAHLFRTRQSNINFRVANSLVSQGRLFKVSPESLYCGLEMPYWFAYVAIENNSLIVYAKHQQNIQAVWLIPFTSLKGVGTSSFNDSSYEDTVMRLHIKLDTPVAEYINETNAKRPLRVSHDILAFRIKSHKYFNFRAFDNFVNDILDYAESEHLNIYKTTHKQFYEDLDWRYKNRSNITVM
ncbi:hypothetical protein E3Q19_01357 [Wallemia mellicola]|nr:hypothetical protein E3Q19_01357 [Wallemia mellicola]TIC74089.1 hypothetical protein E3Q00_02250 [Wallemia mellicola]